LSQESIPQHSLPKDNVIVFESVTVWIPVTSTGMTAKGVLALRSERNEARALCRAMWMAVLATGKMAQFLHFST